MPIPILITGIYFYVCNQYNGIRLWITLFHAFQPLHFCLLPRRLMHAFHTCHVVLVSTWTAWTWIYYLRWKAIWLHDLLPVWLKMSPMLITRHHLVSVFCKKKIDIIIIKCVNLVSNLSACILSQNLRFCKWIMPLNSINVL